MAKALADAGKIVEEGGAGQPAVALRTGAWGDAGRQLAA